MIDICTITQDEAEFNSKRRSSAWTMRQRGDQRYGPYSLVDLQNYVQSGNVATEDLAQSEGMEESIPVIQILGNIPVASPAAKSSASTVAEPRFG